MKEIELLSRLGTESCGEEELFSLERERREMCPHFVPTMHVTGQPIKGDHLRTQGLQNCIALLPR